MYVRNRRVKERNRNSLMIQIFDSDQRNFVAK